MYCLWLIRDDRLSANEPGFEMKTIAIMQLYSHRPLCDICIALIISDLI